MKPATAQLALLFCVSSPCFAQTPVAAAASPTAKTDDTMVLIRGGTIQMGIDAADIPRFQKIFAIENGKLFEDELPRHSVTVKDFYMDKNLVTNAQFKSFLDANPQFSSDRFPKEFDNGNYLQHWKTPDHDNAKPDHPVVNVNWYAAFGYCHSAGKRLPSEAEWEFAARGGRDTLFPWGDELPDPSRANFNNNVGTTTPTPPIPTGSSTWQGTFGNSSPANGRPIRPASEKRNNKSCKQNATPQSGPKFFAIFIRMLRGARSAAAALPATR